MTTLEDLEFRLQEIERTLQLLESKDTPQWHFEVFSDSNWINQEKGSGSDGVIDLSSVFGIPANVRAVIVRVDIHDPTISTLALGDQSGGTDMLVYTGYGNSYDEWVIQQGIVPCDSNGDIWITFGATMHISLYILAYYK